MFPAAAHQAWPQTPSGPMGRLVGGHLLAIFLKPLSVQFAYTIALMVAFIFGGINFLIALALVLRQPPGLQQPPGLTGTSY